MDIAELDYMVMPCGGVAYYDEPKFGINYFCAQCQAIVGSEQQPQSCKNEELKYEMWKSLGGRGWDYFAEPDEYF